MDNVIAEFDRPFQLWTFRVSHAELLFRSNRSQRHSTRMEILFKPVEALKVRASAERLVIRQIRGKAAERIASEVGVSLGGRATPDVFILDDGGPPMYVIAGVVAVREDAGRYSDAWSIPYVQVSRDIARR